MLIGGLLIIVAGLMAFFPSLNDSDTTVDWISLPLVGFPIIVSCILMAFASQESRARKEVIAVPIRLFTLVASLIPLAISTALFFCLFYLSRRCIHAKNPNTLALPAKTAAQISSPTP